MSIDYLLHRYKKSGTDWLQTTAPADRNIEERLQRGSRLAGAAVWPEAPVKQVDHMHLLYEITSQPNKPVGQQLVEALALATRFLNMEQGLISQVGGESCYIEHYFPSEASLEVGQPFPLESSFCGLTMRRGGIVVIEDVKNERCYNHPGYPEFGLQTYLGSVISVDGQAYGTLTFSSSRPNITPFTPSDLEFFELLSRWVGSLLEQRERNGRNIIKEARFRNLVENMEEIFWIYDGDDGKIIYINPAVAKITGFPAETLMEDPNLFLDLLSPEDRTRILAALIPASAREANRATSDEVRITHQDGTVRDILLRSQPLYDHRQNILARAGFALDITDRKSAERVLSKNLKRMSALYNVSRVMSHWHSIPDLLQAAAETIAEVLPADRVTVITFDMGREEVIHFARGGDGHEDVVPVGFEELMSGLSGWVIETKQPALSQKAIPDFRENSEVRKRRLVTRCGGIIVVPIIFQERILGTITAINRPDQRDFHDEDVELMVTISNQLAVVLENSSLYAKEKQRVVELEQANEELDAFAQTVAHDLKTPLGLVMGFTQLLDAELLDREENQQMIDMVVRQSKKMSSIIDEILLLASVREADVKGMPLDMARLVHNAITRHTLNIKDSGAEITCKENWPAALGYGPWIEEVWANYISNAIKYGGTPPQIELGWTREKNRMVRFWVRDHGPGLTAEIQKKLFLQFERAGQDRIEGQGLGLSIVKRILDKLGGEVGVFSVPGEGATFSFTLPAAP